MPPAPLRLVLALLLTITTNACAGDDCDDDSDCLSESCSDGTCDSALVNAAFEDEEEEFTPARPEREPHCQARIHCGALLADACEAQPDCRPALRCTGYFECTTEQWIKGCPVPCELRSERDCSGECSLTFYSCEDRPSCDGLTGEQGTRVPGCELR